MRNPRAIGPIGTLARVAVAAGLVALAVVVGEVRWSEAVLGLVIFPAAQVLVHWIRLRFSVAPLRATGPVGHLVNCMILAVLLLTPATTDATVLWLAGSILLAVWRGYAGCESLAISNWLLRRDDQVGCVVFAPIDVLEARRTAHAGA